MKTYKETKSEITKLVKQHGLSGITGYHIRDMIHDGHGSVNIQNAISYFRFSPKTAKYR